MSIDIAISKKCLFLICPTDGFEPFLTNMFKEQAFFYTALGACFEWKNATQKELAKLIVKQDIKQVLFIVKKNNRFFLDKLKIKYNLAAYPVEKSLQFIEDNMSTTLENWGDKRPNQEILAANYLEYQKDRLIQTSFLGSTLKKHNIAVMSMLYNSNRQTFIKTETLQHHIKLFEDISVN